MKKSNTPKRKMLTREKRLGLSKEWIESYDGKNIVRGYAKWYGVDLLCAIEELRINGVTVDGEYENKVKKSVEAKAQAKRINEENRKKKLTDMHDNYLDNRFIFIAGYTSAGAAYGITLEEFGGDQDKK